MKIILLCFCLFALKIVNADQPRQIFSFKSSNNLFELKPSDTIFADKTVYMDTIYTTEKDYYLYTYTHADNYVWSLYDLSNNKILYSIYNENIRIASKTALISNDGQFVVIVDDYSSGYGFHDLEIAYLYNRDILVKTFLLGDLLNSLCNVSYSISHMRWCNRASISSDNRIEIETNEFYTYQINTSGEIVARTSDPRITEGDDIVTAKIRRLEKDRYEFIICHSVRNKNAIGRTFESNVSDDIMKEIHAYHYGSSFRKNKMETYFHRTFVLRNDQPIITDLRFHNYTNDTNCFIYNTLRDSMP